MSVRRPASRPEPPGADAAARRLALIAADLGVDRQTAPGLPDPSVEPWWADHTRVAEAPRPVPEHEDRPPAEAPALPEPGRHAARRRRVRPDPREALAPLADRLPTLGVPQIAVVALAIAVGLAVTTWWVVRDRTEPLEPVSAEATSPLVATTAGTRAGVPDESATGAPRSEGTSGATGGGTGSGTAPRGGAPAAASVTVDVAGKVRRPGIVVLAAGARVTDALEAAGGPRKGVDLTPLNLARVLVDGEQIVVGGPANGAGPPTGGVGSAGGGSGPLVNLNTAGQAELESLPEVGPVTAQSIIAWREAHGGFTSVDELLEVDGIGDKTLEQISPHVTV